MSALRPLALALALGVAAPAAAGSWDPILRRTAPAPTAERTGARERARALELEAQIRRADEQVERDAEERRLRERADVDAQRRAEERRATTRRLERELDVADLERRAEGDTAAAQEVRAFELERELEAARDGVDRELDEARIRAEVDKK